MIQKLLTWFIIKYKLTRSKRKLLYILLDSVQKNDLSGLCTHVNILTLRKSINLKEAHILNHIINSNPPFNKYDSRYYWEPELKEPRIEWLKEQINKL